MHAAVRACVLRADRLLAALAHRLPVDLAVAALVAAPGRVGARRGRPGRTHGKERACSGLRNRGAVARRVRRIVDAHDAVAAPQQAHAGRRAAANPLERGKARFGVPELLVGPDGVDDPAGVHPRVGVAATERLQEAMAGVRVAIDEPRQHGLASCVDGLASRCTAGRPRQSDRRPRCDLRRSRSAPSSMTRRSASTVMIVPPDDNRDRLVTWSEGSRASPWFEHVFQPAGPRTRRRR